MEKELTIEQQRLLQQIQLNPGCTTTFVQIAINKSNSMANYELQKLMEAGYIYRKKSISNSHRIEYKYYAGKPSQQQECAEQKLAEYKKEQETQEEAKKKDVNDFTARELMFALAKKGFNGTLSTTLHKDFAFEEITPEQFSTLREQGYVGTVSISRLYEVKIGND
jgi:predicted transcriptional regulator